MYKSTTHRNVHQQCVLDDSSGVGKGTTVFLLLVLSKWVINKYTKHSNIHQQCALVDLSRLLDIKRMRNDIPSTNTGSLD